MSGFEIAGLKIHTYGFMYLLSFLLIYLILYVLLKIKKFSFNKYLEQIFKNYLDDLFIYVIGFGILGGRIGYVLLYDFSYYLNNFHKVFFVWEGGMSFVGGIVGGFLGILIFKKIYKLDLPTFYLLTDIITSLVPLGIFFGRIGNFVNKELYGIKLVDIPNDFFVNFIKTIGLTYTYSNIDNFERVNSNFIEAILEGLLLFIILQVVFWKFVSKNKLNYGILSGLFLILYGIIRFICEFLRDYQTNNFIFNGFTKSQYFMIGFIFIGFVLIIYISYFQKKKI